MIHADVPAHRARLAESIRFWHDEMARYRKARRETVMIHVGSTDYAEALGVKANTREQWGNLIQMAARAHVINLAYGAPKYNCVANVPEADDIAPRLEEFLNRYTTLFRMRNIARQIALDSFFGFGVLKVANGKLPAGVAHRVRSDFGPHIRRVSQDYFGFDGSACSWDEVGYMWDITTVPLDEAREFEPFLENNPDATLALEEYTQSSYDRDGVLHNHAGRQRSPQAMTRLINVYLPHAGTVATWPCTADNFGQISGEPLLVEEWTGHHSGPYEILSHLDVPDNLIPVARVESTKNYHHLFNELADITAEQAKSAKYHPIYENGADRDMARLINTEDRKPVPVQDVTKIGSWAIPGPDQSQTAYMSASLNLFKEFAGNIDDTLGLGPTAPTAKQSELIRSRTTASGAEDRQRMEDVMVMAATKLGHLALNDDSLTLRARQPIPKSDLTRPLDWLPFSLMPRTEYIDDFAIEIIPNSMQYISSEERLEKIQTIAAQLAQMAQLPAHGMPVDMQKVADTFARYSHLPEIKEWFPDFFPEHMERKESRALSIRPPGTGQYTRENVSQRSNQGALNQALTQQPQPGSGGVTLGAA